MSRLLSVFLVCLLMSESYGSVVSATLTPSIGQYPLLGDPRSYGLVDPNGVSTPQNFVTGTSTWGSPNPTSLKKEGFSASDIAYVSLSGSWNNSATAGTRLIGLLAQAKMSSAGADYADAAGVLSFTVGSGVDVTISTLFNPSPAGANSFASLYEDGVLVVGPAWSLAVGKAYELRAGARVTGSSPVTTVSGYPSIDRISESTIDLMFVGPTGGGGQVPEPASLAVFGLLGLGGVAARRARRMLGM